MKKTALGFIALAMSLMATTVNAFNGAGDIRSINRCDENGKRLEPMSSGENAIVGENVYFRIRLENVHGRDLANLSKENPWKLYHNGDVVEEAKKAIGIIVSGELRYADIVKIKQPSSVDKVGENEGLSNYLICYTDIICAYKVRSGDLAFPMMLANADGENVSVSGGDAYLLEAGYAFKAKQWSTGETIGDANSGTLVSATLSFGNSDLPTSESALWEKDYTLGQANIRIKAVDFAEHDMALDQDEASRIKMTVEGGTNSESGVAHFMIKNDGKFEFFKDKEAPVSKIMKGPDGTESAYWYVRKTIPAGSSSFDVWVKGNEKDAEGVIYLSSDDSFAVGGSGDHGLNYITATLRCGPPKRNVSVELDDTAPVTPKSDFNTAQRCLTVKLSTAYTNDVTVTIDAAMVSASASVDTPVGTYIGLSENETGGFLGTLKEVTFKTEDMVKGELTKKIHIYVLGGDADTASSGIKFTPIVDNSNGADDFYNEESTTAVLYIKKSKPEIVSPVEGEEFHGVSGGIPHPFTFQITDSYNELRGKYVVEWDVTGSGVWTAVPESDISYDELGVLTVYVAYGEGEYDSRVRVKNAQGVASDTRNIFVQVNQAKVVSAEIVKPAGLSEYGEDVGELEIKFNLTEANNTAMYAFLKPLEDSLPAATNFVSCTAFAGVGGRGIRITSGKLESTSNAKLKVLDGNIKTDPLLYEVVLYTSQNWGQGTEIKNYMSEELEVYIRNTPPSIKAVSMTDSSDLTVNGGKFSVKSYVGGTKEFWIDQKKISDVAADTNQYDIVWSFTGPNGVTFDQIEVHGSVSEHVSKTFTHEGVYSCSVEVTDKDGGTGVFEFSVEVLPAPKVFITQYESETNRSEVLTYNEDEAASGKASFFVRLSYPAPSDMIVSLTCEKQDADGVCVLHETAVQFKTGDEVKQVYFDELDGTPKTSTRSGCYRVEAEVDPSYGILYESFRIDVFVYNTEPKIVLPIESATTNVWPKDVVMPIAWLIEDVKSDMTNNLTITWSTSEGQVTNYSGSSVSSGVYTNVFKSTGPKWVTIKVTDKDYGETTRTTYYYVEASKSLKVHPIHPYAGGAQSSLASQYDAAEGRGAGRVEANNGTPKIVNFAYEYSLDKSLPDVIVSAWGYKSGEMNEGLDSSGNNAMGSESQKYVYNDIKDSFFYAWVLYTEDADAGTLTGIPSIVPQNPFNRDTPANKVVNLPLEVSGDDSNPVYPSKILEAFFSKEKYVFDNMGDMNADGIPDYYAVKGWTHSDGTMKTIPEAQTGQAIAGSDDKGESSGQTSSSDLANVAGYNSKEAPDFLPKAWNSPNPLKPQTMDWSSGEPFTAHLEIRGFGVGLNELGVSDYSLDANELTALYAACAAAGEPAADYAAATNWATKNAWTPEAINPNTGARLNPLHPDTDGDGFDDGWEYYFWYYAKIGAVVNGVWSRLEGRRFAITNNSLTSVTISADEIEVAFNPHVARDVNAKFGMDFDNDGLTDLEEFVLGTNPCDWDSDGDGAADLWEVMMGTNPCSADKNDSNPDCDFMARLDYAEDTFTLYTLENGDIYALPSATLSSEAVEASATSQTVFKVEVRAGDATDTYWSVTKPAVYELDGKKSLASLVYAYKNISCNGDYLGRLEMLQSGVEVVYVASDDDAVEKPFAVSVGFNWTNPETKDKEVTKKALKVFNYGGDGVTFVPCTSNLVSYVDIPEGKAVVDIRKEATITLIHDQVYNHEGFDPRVAWNIDSNGLLDKRWQKQDSDDEGTFGLAGVPTNTVAYTTSDEFLLLQYRLMTGKIEASDNSNLLQLFRDNTTYPNLPVDFVLDKENSYTPFTYTNSTIMAYWDSLKPSNGSGSGEDSANVHGADTDKDGVPDGWELYVGYNPNDKVDGGSHIDTDKLSLAQEYAGVDSCNAYTNRYEGNTLVYPEAYTITKNHPGKTDNWWNKFFPTDPNNSDTDGDGLNDSQERDKWSGSLPVGYNEYPASFSFIYGDNSEKYAEDGKTTCFKGGGLNPCSVDTDCDLLPDAWEYEFAGVNWGADNHSVTAPASLSKSDEMALTVGIAYHTKTNGGDHIRGGMDGTDAGDANYDYDNDGLANFQEYLVQTLRHLRYDDSLTPLMGVDPTSKQFVRFIQFSAWDGNAFAKKCNESGFTGLGAWQFRKLGYFALPPRKWDPIALHTTGLSACKNYAHSEGAGYRVLLRPTIDVPLIGEVQASGYACTDPRRIDTDNDGMDDYYELFHGLNPLLGTASDPMEYTATGLRNWEVYDVIAKAYAGKVRYDGIPFSAWKNNWVLDENRASNGQPDFHAIMHPWMMGTMECDADGDGLRNDEESLKVNVAAPQNTHTDPTPLWMTDSTSARFASFTAQYYNPDPYIKEVPEYMESVTKPDIFRYSKWTDFANDNRTFTRYNKEDGSQDEISATVLREGSGGMNRNWMFSFEENEGYDTDRDFRRDASELVKGVDPTSDPLNYMDPNRRQALYLPGDKSAAVSYESEARREVGTEADMLKQFTAECWICPEGAQMNAVVFERVAVYGPSTLSNNLNYVRANIRIGFDENGKLYGEYEGSTIDSGANRVTFKNELPVDAWTHVAFSYDGSTLALYLNGEIAPVDSIHNAKLIPANGIMGILQYPDGSVSQYEGYRALPVANIIGARALNPDAVLVNSETDWADFSDHFKGWVDEVRVWDGARPADDVRSDFMKRYTFDDVKKNREDVYSRWSIGANRAGSDGLVLPSELLFHYNFVSLPGGIEECNVMTLPSGFQKAVLDNVRKPNTGDIDIALDVGWWSKLSVNSKVYSNYAYVPWIPNTVAHMPIFDGSTVDSRYWSESEAGVYSNGDKYSYNNSANPYVGYAYRYDKLNRLIKLSLMENSGVYSNATAIAELVKKYKFQLRSDYVGSTDLVPLGGAYAKRKADFWDNQGAMDAWTLTSAYYEVPDADGTDIPDWAEKLGFTTVEAYLRALAEGLVPAEGFQIFNGDFKNKADANNDGLVDWWQNLNDLKGVATADTDMDGLADYAEYLISNVFQFAQVDPRLTKTDGIEFDYFHKVGKLYLGEMFSDHDFIEDWWEDNYRDAAETAKYDPHRDADNDGWSNYAERRAGTMPNRTANVIIDSDIWPEYPVPRLYVNVHYAKALTTTAPVILQAYSDAHAIEPNAKWELAGAAVDGDNELPPKVLGLYPDPATTKKYYLGRDIIPGTLNVVVANPEIVGGDAFALTREHLTAQDKAELYVLGTDTKIGAVDYYTGECEINFDMIPRKLGYNSDKMEITGIANGDWGMDVKSSYFKIKYSATRVQGSAPWEFMLTDANTGHLREGLNTFKAFVDLDGSGTYTVGEPFGILRDVDVKWNQCKIDIEVKDPSEHLLRADLGFSDDEASSSRNTLIKVYRKAVNGKTDNSYGKIVNPFLFELNIGNRTYLHEGDFLRNGEFDVDWNTFKADVLNSAMVANGKMNVTNVTYRVEVHSSEQTVSNVFEVTRHFTATQIAPTPVNVNGVNYGARPVFRWKYGSSAAQSDWETFTAFSIQVSVGATEVWNSGPRALPPRLPDGEFEWTAPICAEDLLSANHVFSNTNNYTWKISLHNARYQSAAWSAAQPFRMNVYGENEPNPTRKGIAKLAVKYFGPGKVNTSISSLNGIVRVEAYDSPDFSGEPLGAAFVKDMVSLTNTAHEVNATIVGLEPGAYYVLAYVDCNGNRKRDDFESWGYVCPRGDVVSKAIFDPVSIKVGDGIAVKETLYIEDTDVDQDCLPDIYEYDAASGKGDFLAAKGAPKNGNDGYVAVNPELVDEISRNSGNTAAYMFSAGMLSMPSDLVALSLGIDTAENTVEESTLAIRSIALEDGTVNLTVGAKANEPDLGTLFVKDSTVTATIVVKYADSLDGEWMSTEVTKTFAINEGGVSDELSFSLSELGLDPSKGFFKVELK